MKLASFSVLNYRSIVKTEKLLLAESTVLIGPNNEGKSNILHALVTSLTILTRLASPVRFVQSRSAKGEVSKYIYRGLYDWDDDFPVSKQEKQPNGVSVFKLEFILSESERTSFKSRIGSSLNGTLPIELTVGKDVALLRITKQGKGAATLLKKADKICLFVSRLLDHVYIPAIRTADSAKKVVNGMLERELAQLEGDPEYQAAIEEIAKIQKPVLEKMEASIQKTLREFLPNVVNVTISMASEDRYRALRRCSITIDDGVPTALERKGDGVQSLAALSLMRHASETNAGNKDIILAIEEPESHLHPRAIHQLKNVISDIATKGQIIMTTHCPLFVDRVNVGSNIIVTKNRAVPAKSISEIRNVLGVRAADNLQHAELVLVVEGDEDRIEVASLLSHYSSLVASAFKQGTLAIDCLNGGTNLRYKLSMLRESLCNVYVLLDDDDCGRKSFERAEQELLITQADVTFTVCQGMNEAEFEDFIDPELYHDAIRNGFGVTVRAPKFKSNKKWSERMKDVFKQHGKQWSDRVEIQVKRAVAELVEAHPEKALLKAKRDAFDSFLTAIESKLIECSNSIEAK
jgi:putative ATP-dependent endonuclease of OLD family